MLNAFRNQLHQLSSDPRDPFPSIVRKLVGSHAADRFEQPLREMVLSLPDMVHQIHLWSDEPALPAELKRIHAFVLRYLYHPNDFLSERNFGFFGYVDDAYLAAYAYDRTLRAYDLTGLKPFIEDPSIPKRLVDWIDATQDLLPKETARINQLIDEMKFHNGLHWAINRASQGTHLARKLEKAVLHK